MSDYEPYGPEWEKEMMRMPRLVLVKMFATVKKDEHRKKLLVSLPIRLFAGMLIAIAMRFDGEAKEHILTEVAPYINTDVKRVLNEVQKVLDDLVTQRLDQRTNGVIKKEITTMCKCLDPCKCDDTDTIDPRDERFSKLAKATKPPHPVSSTALNGYNPLSLLEDVVQIAKYFSWQDEVGDKRAVDIICEIHNGKYGSQEGIWPQVDKVLFKLKGL